MNDHRETVNTKAHSRSENRTYKQLALPTNIEHSGLERECYGQAPKDEWCGFL